MKPARRSFKSFLGATLEYQESEQINPEILEGMVAQLREGDATLIHPICKGHYKMVMGIVADSCRSRQKAADIEGAAFLALVEAVTNSCPHIDSTGVFQPSRLYDNNITFYITTTVKFAIKDEYGNDHIMRMPARTIRDKIAKGEKFENIVPGAGMQILADTPGVDSVDGDDGVNHNMGFVLPFIVPISKPDFPCLEFTEALTKSIENETERAIMKLRSEGYGYAEIGVKVGLSTGRVGQLVPIIEARFNRFYP